MWPKGETTQEILAEVRSGDADAVNRLLERHRESVKRLVKMRLDTRIQKRLDVSDVVQDVMVEAHRRLSGYLENPVLDFHLWLRQIARDRIIDAHRRHRGSDKRSVDREQPNQLPAGMDHSTMDLAAQLMDREITPAAAAAQRELAQVVEQALVRLDEAEHEIILMRHYEQLTNQEVAAVLGLSEPAASMRYLRAIRKLRSFFGGAVPESDST